MEPLVSGNETDKLSGSVAKHLRRYFDLHGGVLPPPGLYNRILREVEGPLISRDTPPQIDVKPQHNRDPKGAGANLTFGKDHINGGRVWGTTHIIYRMMRVQRTLLGINMTRTSRWWRQRHVQNAFTLGLVLLGPVLAGLTYFVLGCLRFWPSYQRFWLPSLPCCRLTLALRAGFPIVCGTS